MIKKVIWEVNKCREKIDKKREKLSIIAVILMLSVAAAGCGEIAEEQSGNKDDTQAESSLEAGVKFETEKTADTETETGADAGVETELESDITSEQDVLDSDAEKDIRSVLSAYQDYIDDNMMFDDDSLEQWNSDHGGICTLIYADDDDIPECYFYMYYGMPVLLRYKDGQVLAVSDDFAYSSCCYQERTGKLCFISTPGGNKVHIFEEFSTDQNEVIVTGMAHTLTVLGGPDAEPYYAVMNDNSTKVDNLEDLTQVDEAEYEEYINSFGDYINIIEQEPMSPSVEDAYKILENIGWKQAYKEFPESDLPWDEWTGEYETDKESAFERSSFTLAYIDDDEIPELFISGPGPNDYSLLI